MRNESFCCFGNTDIDGFIKSQGWTWFSNIHGIISYIAEDTYYKDGKVYNLVVRSYHFFVKHKNGLKVYLNNGGFYVNTEFGRVYVNGVVNGEYSIDFKRNATSQF